MRLVFLILALAACTETEEERFDYLWSGAGKYCGGGSSGTSYEDVTDVVACMNDALAIRQRAYLVRSTPDSSMYDTYTYYFAVDHQVLVWTYRGATEYSNEPSAHQTMTCTGMRVGVSPVTNGAFAELVGCVATN